MSDELIRAVGKLEGKMESVHGYIKSVDEKVDSVDKKVEHIDKRLDQQQKKIWFLSGTVSVSGTVLALLGKHLIVG